MLPYIAMTHPWVLIKLKIALIPPSPNKGALLGNFAEFSQGLHNAFLIRVTYCDMYQVGLIMAENKRHRDTEILCTVSCGVHVKKHYKVYIYIYIYILPWIDS